MDILVTQASKVITLILEPSKINVMKFKEAFLKDDNLLGCVVTDVDNIITVDMTDSTYLAVDKVSYTLSVSLAEYIINEYEGSLVKKTIKANYCHFSEPDKQAIYDIVIGKLHNQQKEFSLTLMQIRRKNMLNKKLLSHIQSREDFMVEGIVNFALKDYRKELLEVVDNAVDDFLIQREYKEFISLLCHMVDLNEPQHDIVYIEDDDDDVYKLTDHMGNKLEHRIKDTDSSSDWLVAELVSLAPRKIVIRTDFLSESHEKTLKDVFKGKIIKEV